MLRLSLFATVASAIHWIAPAGDPECKLGHRSFSADTSLPMVCCPKYCGKCDDFAGCDAVNGQDSGNACCASKVRAKICENNSEDPYCLGKCSDKSAPCSLGLKQEFTAPAESSAAADCNESVADFKEGCEAAVKGVKPDSPHGGPAQWKGVEERSAKLEEAANAKFAKNMDAGAVGGAETM
jgi:hypothetical protein